MYCFFNYNVSLSVEKHYVNNMYYYIIISIIIISSKPKPKPKPRNHCELNPLNCRDAAEIGEVYVSH